MTAELKPYSGMKDSGIAWLGMIPEHWKIVRQRYLCSTKTGTRDTVHQVDQGKYPFFVRSQTAVKIDTYSFDGEAVLTAGDGDIGKIFHYINGKFDFHQRVYKFSDFREVLGKFYFYYARANLHQEVLRLSAKSTVDSIRLPMLQNFPVVIPSVPEQVAIARYLDYVDVRVRRLTEAKRKLVGLLTEYKQAIVHRAVTRGLDPNVPLKDSGIEWLNMVPQHWKITRVKTEFDSFNSRRVPLSSPERGTMTSRKYDYYGASGVIDKVEDYLFDDELLLIAEDGANLVLRNLPLAIIARGKFWVNNHAHILKPKRGNLEYLAAVMESLNYKPWISGAAQPKLTKDRLMAIAIAVPPPAEQDKIIESVHTETVPLSIAIARAERQIELLNEYRTRLIADVVTGKLDVRDATLDPEERAS